MEAAALVPADTPLQVPPTEVSGETTTWSRLKLGALVGLGYLYLGGLLTLLVFGGSALLLRAPFVGIALLALAVAVGRLLRVEDKAPEGVPLATLEAPLLEQLVEDVRRSVGARRPTVVLDLQSNASVCEVGRRLPLTGHRVYLSIGLPLILALSVEEFEAVVAHELAHVSRRHGRWALWVWNSLERWRRISTNLERSEHWGRRLVRRFFRFYAPRLERSGLAFKRAHEYEADRLAASLVGVQCYTRALTRLCLFPDLVDQVWEQIDPSVAGHGGHPNAPSTLAEELRRRPVPDARQLLSYRFQYEVADTHPTLAQRLSALGASEVGLEASAPPQQTAAEVLLGASYARTLAAANDFWWSHVAEWWHARSGELQSARDRLVELENEDSDETLYERARLVELISGSLAAGPLCERLLEEHPDDPFLLFVSGRALLADGDDRGLQRLRQAAEFEPEAVFPATRRAQEFLVREGRFDEADSWRRYAEGYAQVRAAADEERVTVRRSDEVVEHGLPPELVDKVVAALEPFKLKRAYLARRHLRQLHDHDPQWILAVERRGLERKRALQRTVHDVVVAVSPVFGTHRFWVISGSNYSALIARMSRSPGALVLGRERFTTRLLRRPLRTRTVVIALCAFLALPLAIVVVFH